MEERLMLSQPFFFPGCTAELRYNRKQAELDAPGFPMGGEHE